MRGSMTENRGVWGMVIGSYSILSLLFYVNEANNRCSVGVILGSTHELLNRK
jgi:hypothetical protein